MLRGLTAVFLTLCALLSASPVALKLDRFGGPSPGFRIADGVCEIHGPMSVLATPAGASPGENAVIEFEYFCASGVPQFALLPGPPFEAKTATMLPAVGRSETWSTYAARITPSGGPLPGGWRELRLDLPLAGDGVLQIRNARLRPERAGEFAAAATKPSAATGEKALQAYLDHRFPAVIGNVAVGKDKVRIEGSCGTAGEPVYLADIPMETMIGGPHDRASLVPVKPDDKGRFSVDLPRRSQRDGREYDRLTSRWQLVGESGGEVRPVSHARYADRVDCRSPRLPPARPSNKKGLGGWHLGRLPGELTDLGISAVTVNVMIHTLVSLQPGPDTVPFQWQGRTYHAREDALAGFDATFLEAAKHGVMVSAILLVANPAKDRDPVVRLLGHPDAVKDGIFAMPNVTSPDGIALYGAILNLMAERWSRPDGKYGRVHHWIMHNEVDAGWVWTNAGEKPAVVYMDLYQRSLRLMDLIIRQYDPHGRAFVSLTHHWARQGEPHWYGSRKLLETLASFTRAEGDFPWALAYHPYPQNLFNPRTWEDDQAVFSFDSPKITPKNIEVLDAYMRRPDMLYQGEIRPVHLSENGFNSKDYSDESLGDQAAGMALAWKKISRLPSIQSWQYHNWIDNRGEGGLRIGLRKFPDEPGDPLGRKPIWHLYQALGTPREDAACAPYLKTIGLGSWSEAIHGGPVR